MSGHAVLSQPDHKGNVGVFLVEEEGAEVVEVGGV